MELGQYDHDAARARNTDGESLIKVEFKEKPGATWLIPGSSVFSAKKIRAPVKFELYDHRDELQKRVRVEDVKPIQSRRRSPGWRSKTFSRSSKSRSKRAGSNTTAASPTAFSLRSA